MLVKILYWSPDVELIFSEHFHSITDHIFHFKIRLWFYGLLNRTIGLDIDILLTLASDYDKQKSKTFIQIFSLKINWFELTYHKAGLLMQYPRKYQAKKVMKFRVLKVESTNFTMSGSQSFRGSFMIPVM